MNLGFFFYFLQITKAINTKKFIVGEWQVYNEANTISLYTVEFHDKKNNSNTTNNKESSIFGSIWSNRIDELDKDDQLDNFDPDNFNICSFELIFSSPNEGKIENLNYNIEKENHFLHLSHFFINETENKNVIAMLNSESLKLTCNFINLTHGTIKYQILNGDNKDEIKLNIVKSPKLSFFQWRKYFIYLFYAVFIFVFCRTILVTRSSLIQRARENQTVTDKENTIKKESSQQNTENEETQHNSNIKDHDHVKTE